jgi:hypothetical protein
MVKMETKNEGVLTSLARTVGTTAGVIVAKTTQLKAEVVKMGGATASASAKKPARKSTTKKAAAKKAAPKKGTPKKPISRASAKKKKKTTTVSRKRK